MGYILHINLIVFVDLWKHFHIFESKPSFLWYIYIRSFGVASQSDDLQAKMSPPEGTAVTQLKLSCKMQH